ncbi:MAG: arginine--tRNA ligase [Ilumatobacteraceae bacterium]|nr:arginine--tRNA ligase [Ilumatobacteraceae bacterium]
MSDPLLAVSERFAWAFAAVAGEVVDPVVRPSDHADAQINGALGVAKKLGTNPRQVAEQVLVAVGDVSDMCSGLEIAGPGFINVTLSNQFLSTQLKSAMNDQCLGVRVAPIRLTAVVDYSAPNVAKEMHVGHLRSTVIGDSIVRLLEFVGHTVIRENHIGDWGTPFGMLIEHLIDIGQNTAAQELGVGDLDGFYREARNKFDADDAFKERARARVVLLQGGDPDTLHLWRTLVSESTRYFNQVYQLLDVLLTDADIVGESSYNDLLAPVVERLREAKLLEVSDGADVVFPAGFTNRDGDPLPLIIRKGDGGYNYATSDLACVIDRVERLGASLLIYVVGAPQAQHLSMVETVATQVGWLAPPVQMMHVAFGNVLGSDGKMLKSRVGDTVKLAALLEEAVERATAAIAQKNPDMSEHERSQVAHMIGIGAVKYSDLSTDRVRDYVFDWERMLSFDGNTAPYLQYAHARMCSIFRRAGIERTAVRSVMPTILDPRERALAIRVLQFDSAVWDALDRYSPHRLCTYLYELATDFTAFYEHCPVLKADTDEQRLSRLNLCDAAARVLECGLNLLGIRAPEQM